MTRRHAMAVLLSSPPLLAAGRGQVYPAERLRYADPATEGEVFRITSPKSSSVLPAAGHHCVSARGNFIVYCSDRAGGGLQIFRQELKNNEPRQITDDSAILASSLAMTADERHLYYADGAVIRSVAPGGGRERECYTAEAPIQAMNITTDGLFAAVATGGRLLLVPLLAKAPAKVLAEASADSPLPRPRRASLIYRAGEQWFLAHLDGSVNRPLKPMEGSGCALWSADGRTIAYLKGSTLMELEADTGVDRLLGKTSGFAQFARNTDGSVFAGLSGSKAQPHVLLLLRVTRRERTICEHKSSTVAAPFFSPNSLRMFYQSDRDGKAALYMVALDKLVEKTEESSL